MTSSMAVTFNPRANWGSDLYWLGTQFSMGHRHMFNASQTLESGSDQRWNQAERTFIHIARASASEGSSSMHPPANMTIQGGHHPSHWNHAPSSSRYPSSIHNGELPVYQPQARGPSYNPFPPQTANANYYTYPDNYSQYPSSSNLQPIPGPDIGSYDQRPSSFRGQYKRKAPEYPPVCDRGSTSRSYDVGSSSNLHLPSDPWLEKHDTEYHRGPHESLQSHSAHNLSICNEGMLRNVRSRTAVDVETNINAPLMELNRSSVSLANHGLTPGLDSSFLSHGPNSVYAQNSHPSGFVDNSRYESDLTINRNPAPQRVIGYGPRMVPTFRASSRNLRYGHVATSDERLQMISERYPSRDPRPFPNIRWHQNDRSGRNLAWDEGYEPYTDDAHFNGQLTPEGIMLDHSAFYGSRTMLDQHRDMRLDIDNMGYEELLALGDRIGNVNTGLSDGLISKCMKESVFCLSDMSQDEGTCVICLEEYKNMDNVGALRVCAHDFHVDCIRKWLSMKNSCPICKQSAAVDGQ